MRVGASGTDAGVIISPAFGQGVNTFSSHGPLTGVLSILKAAVRGPFSLEEMPASACREGADTVIGICAWALAAIHPARTAIPAPIIKFRVAFILGLISNQPLLSRFTSHFMAHSSLVSHTLLLGTTVLLPSSQS